MVSFLIGAGIATLLILCCVAVFYEVFAHVWLWLPKMERHPRRQIVVTTLAAFFCHTVAVWIFGISYYFLVNQFGFGGLHGDEGQDLLSYIYFSGVTYSSLGFGDVYPTGNLRLLVAVEAILGLVLIGWTVAFTYLCTEKYLAHRLKHSGRKRKD